MFSISASTAFDMQGYHIVTHLFNGLNVVQCVVDAPDNTAWLNNMPWLPAIFALLGATLVFELTG
jgi:hypothetical protein